MKQPLSLLNRLCCIVAVAACLTSCVSTKKYSAYVDQRTKTERAERAQEEWLVVNVPFSEQKGNNYKQVRSSFIPAILYWEWNSTIECEIDPYTAAAYIRSGIYQAADSLDLKSKLNGKQLVVNFTQVPGKFLYENKGNAVILIFAHVTTAVEAISPMAVSLELTYQLKENDTVIKEGEGYVRNRQEPIRNRWNTTRKFTWKYLDEFEKEANRMGAESVAGIIRQIENS